MQNRLGRRISEQPGIDNQTPKSWDQIYIPWSRRALAALFIADSIINRFEIATQILDATFLTTKTYMDYVELQYWGKISLEDVESFTFSWKTPKGLFLKELKARKIPIYKLDPKTGIFEPWKQ